jgi:hypothetical protein
MNNSKMENKMDNIKWTKMDKNKHKIKWTTTNGK